MSKGLEKKSAALVFAALGDDTRLALVKKLGRGDALSATDLSDGGELTRQAIMKHLRVLEDAGLVRHARQGREVLYALEAARVDEAREYLDAISTSWDRAIERLRKQVEST